MITEDNFIKHCISCKPTKYDRERHISLMFKIFSDGKSVAAFCAEALIAKTTFYNWLEIHKEFKDAYDIMISTAQKIWEDYPKTNPDFNFPYWSTIMRNRFGYGKPKVRIVKDTTPLARMNAIWDGLGEGELSAQEATQLGSLITVQNNILNGQPPESEQFKRDTREELMDKISAIQKVIDYSEGKKHEK
jgi:hypothetical protein